VGGAAGAIEAGRAFVSLYADMTELAAGLKKEGPAVAAWAAGVGKDVSDKISGGFQSAAASAAALGSQTHASMAQASTSINNVGAAAFRVPSAFGAASGSLKFIVGNLGNIGRAAGLASWGLFGVSQVMRAMGKDTTQIDKVKTALSRIGWAAFGANMAINGMLLPLRAVGAASQLIGGGVRRIGGMLQGGGRLGSIASMGAMAAGPAASVDAESGVAEGEKKSGGGFASSLMPILTGLAIAGPVGAAATGLGMWIAGALSRAGKEGSKGFFGELIDRAQAWGAWFGGMWSQISAKFKAVFGGMISSGESFLTQLEKAFIPLTHAIENVWLPAFLGAIEYVGSFFKMNTDQMGGSWSAWILDSIKALAEFVGNFDLYFQIAQQAIVLWAANAILRFGDFFANVGEWFVWFGSNWKSVLLDAGNLVVSFATNMATNFINGFKAIMDFAKGKGFKFEATNPLKGFESSIKELPKLTRSALGETSPELESLYKKLGERQKQAAEVGHLIAGVNKTAEAEKQKSVDTKFGATTSQSQEAYSMLAKLQNQSGGKDPVLEVNKQQLAEQKKATKAIEKLQDKVFGGLKEFAIP
jgi:hypothetical protein